MATSSGQRRPLSHSHLGSPDHAAEFRHRSQKCGVIQKERAISFHLSSLSCSPPGPNAEGCKSQACTVRRWNRHIYVWALLTYQLYQLLSSMSSTNSRIRSDILLPIFAILPAFRSRVNSQNQYLGFFLHLLQSLYSTHLLAKCQ